MVGCGRERRSARAEDELRDEGDGMGKGAKAVLCLHGARVGKEEEEKFLVSCRLTAVIGRYMHSCTHKMHDDCKRKQPMKAAAHLHRYCAASMAAGRVSSAKGNFSSTVLSHRVPSLMPFCKGNLYYI